MTDTNTASQLFDADVRVETIIWIPGAVGCESVPDSLSEDFGENMPERADAPLYMQLPALARFAEGEEWPSGEELQEALIRTPGFLVQAATPVRTYTGDKGVYCGSWGCYRTEWLYAATEAEIGPVILAWAEAEVAAMKAKSAA